MIAIRDRPIAAPKDIWDLAASAPASAPAADAKSAPAHIDLDALAAKFGGRDAPATLPADFDFSKPPTAGTSHAARGYWILRTLVALGTPLGGYFVLFIVLPWIVRGFSPALKS